MSVSSSPTRSVAALLTTLGVLVLAAWFLLGVVHLGDRYGVTGTSSVWMGLAQYARDGTLFPPLYDGEHFAGTRYMPLAILLHAGLATLTGEYLVAAKLLGLASGLALIAGVVVAVRRIGASMPVALAVAGVIVASPVGMIATLGMRPETIPTILQLAAVGVTLGRWRRATPYLAGILCALALLAKLTAVWAPIAICIWLVIHRPRRDAALFVGATALSAVVLLAVVAVWSGGRIWTNLLELASAGLSPIDVITVPTRLLAHLSAEQGVVLLAPLAVLAVLAVLAARGWRGLTLLQLGLLAATLVTIFIYTDRGADYNHLLDVAVLTGLVAVEFVVVPLAGDRWRASVLHATLIVGLTLSLAVGPGIDLGLAARHALSRSGEPIYDARPLDGIVATESTVLSDTPYLPISLGQRPVVLDTFMLGRIGQRHPETVQQLRDRVERQEFDSVILQFDIDGPSFPAYFGPDDVGAPVSQAIRERYRLDRIIATDEVSFTYTAGPLWVYVPD